MSKFVIPIPKRYEQYIIVNEKKDYNLFEGRGNGRQVIIRFPENLGASIIHTEKSKGVELMPIQWRPKVSHHSGITAQPDNYSFDFMQITLKSGIMKNGEEVSGGTFGSTKGVWGQTTPYEILYILDFIWGMDQERAVARQRQQQKQAELEARVLTPGRIITSHHTTQANWITKKQLEEMPIIQLNRIYKDYKDRFQ